MFWKRSLPPLQNSGLSDVWDPGGQNSVLSAPVWRMHPSGWDSVDTHVACPSKNASRARYRGRGPPQLPFLGGTSLGSQAQPLTFGRFVSGRSRVGRGV